jgi:hypothetical protein
MRDVQYEETDNVAILKTGSGTEWLVSDSAVHLSEWT